MTILLILFLICLVALAWLWEHQPAGRRVEADASLPTPKPTDDKPALSPMMEHKTEHAFLKRLIEHDASEETRQLLEGLVQTERDGKRIRRAMSVMGMLFVLSLTGLGYCAILLPDIFRNPEHLVMRGLGYFGLGSLISQGAFFGYLLWHRVAVSRLRRKCRRRVLALAHHLKSPAAADLVQAGSQSSSGFPGSSFQPIGMTPHDSLGQQALRSQA